MKPPHGTTHSDSTRQRQTNELVPAPLAYRRDQCLPLLSNQFPSSSTIATTSHSAINISNMGTHADVVMSSANGDMSMTAMPTPDEHNEDEVVSPQTKQQKLIKLGLLISLIVVIIYVILDYTVSVLLRKTSQTV